jgi:hypothetical protein
MSQVSSPSALNYPLLVGLKDLAKIVSLSVSTLRNHIQAGMPCLRRGRKILVDPTEAVAWLKQHLSGSYIEDDDLNSLLDAIIQDLE